MTHSSKSLLLFIGDLFILLGSLWATVEIYQLSAVQGYGFIDHLNAFKVIFPIWIIIFYVEGIYSLRTFNRNGLTVSLLRSGIANTFFAFAFFYLFPQENISPKTNILILVALNALGIFFFRKLFFYIFSSTNLSLKVAAIGDPVHINEINLILKEKPYLGFEITTTSKTYPESLPENVIAIDRSYFNDEKLMQKVLADIEGKVIMEMSQFSELVTGKVHPSSINSSWFIQNVTKSNDRLYRLAKAVLDRGTALLLALVFLPIFILLIPFLLIVSGRPLLYSQIRTGLNNKPFRIYKLRSMTTDAEKSGAKWAAPGDARVTPIGKFLRMSRLDEVPQLWNIINGDMSIVGPRPERPEIIKEKLEVNLPFYNFRHLVKPGVTGWAQVNYRYGYSEEDSLIKLTYDLYYVKNKSIWLDIRIILKTIKTVITGMGH